MKNREEHVVTPDTWVRLLSSCDAFKQGYTSYMKGLPFDYDIEDQKIAIQYTRGRHFAAYSKSRALPKSMWKNGILSKAAQGRLAGISNRYGVI